MLKPIQTLDLENDNTQSTSFVVLFTSGFYRVLKQNSSGLIAMKHKLNYTVEPVGSKLTTLFIYFFILRIKERKLVQWRLEVELFMPCI